MTRSQDLELKLSESRSGIQALLDTPHEKRNPAHDAILKKATAEHQQLETEFRAAMVAEEKIETRKIADTAPLRKRAEIRNWIADSLGLKKLAGAEAELASELRLPPQSIPTQLLAEHRADVVATSGSAATQTNQEPTQPRVFPMMISDRLGIDKPTVPVGKESYPILTGGASGSMAAAGASVDAEAVAFSTKSLSPVRVTARYLFNQEDVLVMPDFEMTLRRDLSTALAHQIDDQILNGNGTAPNIAGFFNAGSGLTQPSNPANQANGAAYFTVTLSNLANEIDGIWAHGLNELTMLVGHETQSLLIQSFRANEVDTSIMDYLTSRLRSIFSSDRVPSPTANNQKAVVYKSGQMVRTAVCPVWQASQLIVDPYSKSSAGQTALTLHSFFNFAVLRNDAYAIASYRTKYGSN